MLGSLAAYYICLSTMRFLLVRYSYRHGFGENLTAEWRRYRLCGVILVIMNLALAGMVILAVDQNEGFKYAGVLIYVMALYTFYIMIMAVVNVVRYRKYHSPVISAARKVSLAADIPLFSSAYDRIYRSRHLRHYCRNGHFYDNPLYTTVKVK